MPARSAFLLAGVTALLLAGGLVTAVRETAAQADVIIALDVDIRGNTAKLVGSTEDCLSVESGATFDVDIIIKNVENLLGWESPFVYNKRILNVIAVDVNQFQAADGSTGLINASEAVPDGDGVFLVAAADPKRVDSGSGVLARLTLQAVGTGTSPAKLEHDFNGDGTPDLRPTLTSLKFATTSHPGDTNGDRQYDGPIPAARIAVGEPCRTVPSPTSTPAPPPSLTPAPTATPTQPPPVSDADGDGVPDADDHCPDTAAASSVDASGCSTQQEEDIKDETRARLLDEATAGLNLAVTLDTVTAGGSTTVLAVFADQNGAPVPGTDVIFKIEKQPGTGADLDGGSEVTKTSDAEGVAEAQLNVGNTPGEIVVSATAGGETETVTVTVVAAATADTTTQGGGAPDAEETPGPGDASEDAVPAPGPALPGPGSSGAQSGDGGGLPVWVIGLIAAGLVALAASTLVAWSAARKRTT